MKIKFTLAAILSLTLLMSSCSPKDAASPSVQEASMAVSKESSADTIEDSSSGETDVSSDLETLIVDPDKVIIGDKITSGKDAADALAKSAKHAANSYTVVQTQSYDNKWYREYQVFIPEFKDEITMDGAADIKAYYLQMVEAEKMNMESFMQAMGFTAPDAQIIDAVSDYNYYYFKDYSVDYVKDYLVVENFEVFYAGGAHSNENTYVDNFNMKTGDLLTYNDIFVKGDETSALLNKLIAEDLKAQNIELLQEVDMSPYLEDSAINMLCSNVKITAEGLQFIFNPYEIAAYSDGTVTVLIPYEKLGSSIKITK